MTAVSVSQSVWFQMPQVFSPSCSSTCRLPRSATAVATAAPVSRPPTKETQPISGARTSASDSSPPLPLTRVTGIPSRAASAQARVRHATPPSVGVLAMTAFPANACTSIA
jgi:hypothetical protein